MAYQEKLPKAKPQKPLPSGMERRPMKPTGLVKSKPVKTPRYPMKNVKPKHRMESENDRLNRKYHTAPKNIGVGVGP